VLQSKFNIFDIDFAPSWHLRLFAVFIFIVVVVHVLYVFAEFQDFPFPLAGANKVALERPQVLQLAVPDSSLGRAGILFGILPRKESRVGKDVSKLLSELCHFVKALLFQPSFLAPFPTGVTLVASLDLEPSFVGIKERQGIPVIRIQLFTRRFAVCVTVGSIGKWCLDAQGCSQGQHGLHLTENRTH
jgi:hypothetical protein